MIDHTKDSLFDALEIDEKEFTQLLEMLVNQSDTADAKLSILKEYEKKNKGLLLSTIFSQLWIETSSIATQSYLQNDKALSYILEADTSILYNLITTITAIIAVGTSLEPKAKLMFYCLLIPALCATGAVPASMISEQLAEIVKMQEASVDDLIHTSARLLELYSNHAPLETDLDNETDSEPEPEQKNIH